MSPVAAGLDALLAILLLAALVLGAKLNARLKTLRETQSGFAAAVLELDQAAARAEAGLATLKIAQESAHDQLLDRIETARGLIGRLDRASAEAECALARAPEPAASDPQASRTPAPSGALAAIAALAEGRDPSGRLSSQRDMSSRPAASPSSAPPARRPPRGVFDEELFEAASPRRYDRLGPLHPSPGRRAPFGEDR